MKSWLCTPSLLLLLVSATAQPPQMFSYQGIARTAGGTPMSNQSVTLGIFIHQGNAAGTLVYTETHNTTTDQFGMFNIKVGGGTPTLGSFGAIRWGTNNYFEEVYLNGVSMGTSQLLSVPYALNGSSSGFRAHMGTAVPMTPNSSSVINFNAVEFDDGNHISAGSFTVPSNGFYHIESLIHLSIPAYNQVLNVPVHILTTIPGTPYNLDYSNTYTSTYNISTGELDAVIYADAVPVDFAMGRSQPSGNGIEMVLRPSTNVYLTAGQVITVVVQNNSNTISATVLPDFNLTYLSGYKIY